MSNAATIPPDATAKASWDLQPGVIYLNHGSFGPPSRAVSDARRAWQRRLDRQPMDFFVRTYEPAWRAARQRLAEFIGSPQDSLVFVENATAAMNIVAASFALGTGDEVLLTDHEYGAVQRIWHRAAERQGAKVRRVSLPLPIESREQVVDAILAAVNERTKLLVISHITSPTAITLPVAEITAAARRRDVAVCIDGPHAIAQLPLDLLALGCDFYTASCHKWLSAPFGSGFLYVAAARQASIQTPMLSWGRLPPQEPESWTDEFLWSGTRDPSAYLAVPVAIEFLNDFGIERFRRQTHALAAETRGQLVELTGLDPLVPDSPEWFGSMAHVPLPQGDARELQRALWVEHAIEVPIVDWNGQRWIRVSCHLYNDSQHIERLLRALARLL